MARVAKKTVSTGTGFSYRAGGPGRQIKARLRAGDVLIGGILSEFARPSLVVQYKSAGFDFLYIENEHFLFDPTSLADCTFAARSIGLPVIAKTAQLERAETARLLDNGVVGIQLPRTETREDLEMLRSFIKFPPGGTRAVAPGLGNSDYRQPGNWRQWMAEQDDETILVAHIETQAAFERAEEIVSTPGLDMVYVGPGDFSIEMGRPGEYDHPKVIGPMEEILRLCKRYKVPFGTTASGVDGAKRWIRKGAQFFETMDEIAFIYEGAARLVSEYRALIGKRS